MAKKNKSGWYSFVRWFPGEWYLETVAMDPVTLAVYMRLAACSRNNETRPGSLVTTLTGAASSAGVGISALWQALCRMTAFTSGGEELARVETSADGEAWEEITARAAAVRAKDKPDSFMMVRVTFAWITREEDAARRTREADAERKRKKASEGSKDPSDSEGLLRNPTDSDGIRRNPTESDGTHRIPAKSKSKSKSKSKTPPTPTGESGETGDGFEEFWEKYPNHRPSRHEAERSWARARRSAGASEIMAGLERDLACDQWARDAGRYVPHATTWLNQERWTGGGAPSAAVCGGVPGLFSGEAQNPKNPAPARMGELQNV